MPDLHFSATIDAKQVDNIISGLKIVSDPQFAIDALKINDLKAEMLDFLRGIFPTGDLSGGRRKVHLVSGFRTYDFRIADKIGFVLQHRDINNLRTRVILASLDQGSRGYYRFPANPFTSRDGRRLGHFSFTPGKGLNPGHGTPGTDFATASRLHIPARQGIDFMNRTQEFAMTRIEAAKPEFFRKVLAALKSGTSQ